MYTKNRPATCRKGRRRGATASIAALATLGLIALVPGTAAAQLAGPSGTDTFSGQCMMAPGHVHFDPPLTMIPTQDTITVSFTGGSCTGTLDGKKVDGDPISVASTASGISSCEPAGIMEGRFDITIDGHKIGTSFDYRRQGGTTFVVLHGDDGGSGLGVVRAGYGVFDSSDPTAQGLPAPVTGSISLQNLLTECAGAGVSDLDNMLEGLQTTTSISG
jgi:hypothetical protein